jgi:hypothetical protein
MAVLMLEGKREYRVSTEDPRTSTNSLIVLIEDFKLEM